MAFSYVQLIGPHDPDFFEMHHADRQKSERRAMLDLTEMPDDTLLAAYEIEGVLADFGVQWALFERPPWYAAGFGVDLYWPDFKNWAKMDYWTLQEAVCLSLGFKPENGAELKSRFYSRYEPIIPLGPSQFFRNRTAIIKRASFREKNDTKKVSPKVFVSWAKSKGLEVPSELLTAVDYKSDSPRPSMLNSVDKRKYDTSLKVVLGLLAEQYGEDFNSVTREMKEDVSSGLKRFGLALDPKTIAKMLGEAVLARERFVNEQHKKDEKGN